MSANNNEVNMELCTDLLEFASTLRKNPKKRQLTDRLITVRPVIELNGVPLPPPSEGSYSLLPVES